MKGEEARMAKYSFWGVLIVAGIVWSLLVTSSLYSTEPIFDSAHIRSIIIYRPDDKVNKAAEKNKNKLIICREIRYHNVFLPEVDLNEVPNQVLLDLAQGKISSYRFPKEKVTRVKIDFFYFPVRIHKEIQGFRVVYLNNKFYKQPFVMKIICQSGFENWRIEAGWRILPFFAIVAIALFAPGLKKTIASYLLLLLAVIWGAVSGRLAVSLFSCHWLLGLFAVFITFISTMWLSCAFCDQKLVGEYFCQLTDWFIGCEIKSAGILFLVMFGYGCAAVITWSFSVTKIIFSLKAYLLFLAGASCFALFLRLVYHSYCKKAPKEKEAFIEHS